MEPARLPGKSAPLKDCAPGEDLLHLTREVEALREREQTAIRYVREKVNQLLALMGTFPLKPEELDDSTLLSLDPIGIVSDSFAQVLEHIHTTNNELTLAHREIQAIFDSAGAGILVLDNKMRVKAYNAKLGELFLGDGGTDVIG